MQESMVPNWFLRAALPINNHPHDVYQGSVKLSFLITNINKDRWYGLGYLGVVWLFILNIMFVASSQGCYHFLKIQIYVSGSDCRYHYSWRNGKRGETIRFVIFPKKNHSNCAGVTGVHNVWGSCEKWQQLQGQGTTHGTENRMKLVGISPWFAATLIRLLVIRSKSSDYPGLFVMIFISETHLEEFPLSLMGSLQLLLLCHMTGKVSYVTRELKLFCTYPSWEPLRAIMRATMSMLEFIVNGIITILLPYLYPCCYVFFITPCRIWDLWGSIGIVRGGVGQPGSIKSTDLLSSLQPSGHWPRSLPSPGIGPQNWHRGIGKLYLQRQYYLQHIKIWQ